MAQKPEPNLLQALINGGDSKENAAIGAGATAALVSMFGGGKIADTVAGALGGLAGWMGFMDNKTGHAIGAGLMAAAATGQKGFKGLLTAGVVALGIRLFEGAGSMVAPSIFNNPAPAH
ncbi:MAG: hypothetical protein M3N08_01185 [Pseudomonadota bacterium]|nr:hypothetical protein [Pseudomonadota bacterium]